MSKEVILRESLVIPDKDIEIHSWDLKFLKDKSVLVLNCPRKGFHYHYYPYKGFRIVKGGHIKKELTGKKQRTHLHPSELFEKLIFKNLY